MKRVLSYVCLIAAFVFSTAAEPKQKLKKHKDQGIRDEYIVVLPDGTPPEDVDGMAREIAREYKLELKQVFAYSLQGFLVSGKEKDIEALAGDDRVLLVEQNAEGIMPDPFSAMQWTTWNGEYLWHLDRLDELSYAQRDSQHNMCTEGRNAVAYVIDTGIFAHSEFETPTRIVKSLDFSGPANGATDTSNGCGPAPVLNNTTHGTMVASALAGTHIGASKVKLVSLRIRQCNQNVNSADLLEALDWIAGPNNTYKSMPGVINHSGFVPVWDSLFESYAMAVDRTVTSTKIPFFTSADNYATDACRFSPKHHAYTRTAKKGLAFVVGGTSTSGVVGDDKDYRWQQWVNGQAAIGGGAGSNGGSCVSIYAPAVSIYVAQNLSTTTYARLSGTSFASPLVAGIAARYMAKTKAQTGLTPTATQVYDWLLAQSQTVVQNTSTAPTYWLCVRPNSDFGWQESKYTSNPGTCGTWLGPYEMPFATNTSDARMVYWDEGYCP